MFLLPFIRKFKVLTLIDNYYISTLILVNNIILYLGDKSYALVATLITIIFLDYLKSEKDLKNYINSNIKKYIFTNFKLFFPISIFLMILISFDFILRDEIYSIMGLIFPFLFFITITPMILEIRFKNSDFHFLTIIFFIMIVGNRFGLEMPFPFYNKNIAASIFAISFYVFAKKNTYNIIFAFLVLILFNSLIGLVIFFLSLIKFYLFHFNHKRLNIIYTLIFFSLFLIVFNNYFPREADFLRISNYSQGIMLFLDFSIPGFFSSGSFGRSLLMGTINLESSLLMFFFDYSFLALLLLFPELFIDIKKIDKTLILLKITIGLLSGIFYSPVCYFFLLIISNNKLKH